MVLKAILLGLGLLMGIGTAAAVAVVASAPSPPPSYDAAVRTTLARRGIVPLDLTIAVCPAGPTSCYQRVYATVSVTTDCRADGFFSCARGNAECRLTIPALDVRGAMMPDIRAAGSLADRLRASLDYQQAQIRALIGARRPAAPTRPCRTWWP